MEKPKALSLKEQRELEKAKKAAFKAKREVQQKEEDERKKQELEEAKVAEQLILEQLRKQREEESRKRALDREQEELEKQKKKEAHEKVMEKLRKEREKQLAEQRAIALLPAEERKLEIERQNLISKIESMRDMNGWLPWQSASGIREDSGGYGKLLSRARALGLRY